MAVTHPNIAESVRRGPNHMGGNHQCHYMTDVVRCQESVLSYGVICLLVLENVDDVVEPENTVSAFIIGEDLV